MKRRTVMYLRWRKYFKLRCIDDSAIIRRYVNLDMKHYFNQHLKFWNERTTQI